jgi:hypothetical protein
MDWIMEKMKGREKILNNSEQDNIEKYWNSLDYKEWLRFSHRHDYIQHPIGYWKCYCDKNGNVSWDYIKS